VSKKILLVLSLVFQTSYPVYSFQLCSPVEDKVTPEEKKQKKLAEVLTVFKPDYLITEQLPQDVELKNKIKKLFFEVDPEMTNNPFENNKRGVCNKAIKEFGATEIILHTQDDFRISSLYFKRPDAPINIIYATGYFHDQTPTKQWASPFALLFPTFNILTYDWRGFGDSEGKRGDKLGKTDFGTNAYLDIQAAIDFIKKDNDKPIVLVGFCAGAAMTIKATIEAIKAKQITADALVLNSIFSEFENQFNRAAIVSENRCYMRVIANMGISKAILHNIVSGSLFNLKPIEAIEQINIPCYFEHFVDDPSAIIEEAIQVFNKTKSFKKFELSTIGIHVRIHKDAPFQVRNNFYAFLLESKLLKQEQLDIIKIKDLEDDQKVLNQKPWAHAAGLP
jgi:hypothetical protein